MQSHTGKPANALECTGMGFGVSFLGLKANLTSSNKLLLLNKESKCKQYPTWRSFPLWEGELAFILTLQRPAAKISCYVDRSCRPTDNRVFIAWKKISEWIMRDTELENYVLYEFSSSCADFFFPFFFSTDTKDRCQYLYIYMWNWYLIFLYSNASNIISNTKFILLTAVNLQIKKSALKGILHTKKLCYSLLIQSAVSS